MVWGYYLYFNVYLGTVVKQFDYSTNTMEILAVISVIYCIKDIMGCVYL